MPKGTLLAGAFGGEGGQVGVVVDMGEMEVGEIYQPRVNIGLLDFEGRATGPVLTAGSLEVAEIGDGDRGVQRSEDIPFPVGGRGGGGVGRRGSCAGDEGVSGGWGCGGGGINRVLGGGASPSNKGNSR